jgi:uncharacterized membrane protein
MPTRTRLDWLLEAISLALLTALFVTLWLHWAEMPDRVPQHFGFNGAPNRWGGKGVLWVLPLTGLGIYVLMTAAARFQRLINLPFAVDRSAPEVKRLLLSLSVWMKATVLAVFVYLQQAMMATALGRAQGLGAAFLPFVLLATFVPMIYFTKRLASFRT